MEVVSAKLAEEARERRHSKELLPTLESSATNIVALVATNAKASPDYKKETKLSFSDVKLADVMTHLYF